MAPISASAVRSVKGVLWKSIRSTSYDDKRSVLHASRQPCSHISRTPTLYELRDERLEVRARGLDVDEGGCGLHARVRDDDHGVGGRGEALDERRVVRVAHLAQDRTRALDESVRG
eukprot:6181783-Pleurochrysis_carterae.AAC.1